MDNVFGVDPSEVHIHVRRISVDEIPASDSEAADWLMNAFQLKDQLLSYWLRAISLTKEQKKNFLH
jgi:lysocardiolipin and lysophospholipid acyltransferase